jgi:23S rRNA (guanine745-N1)-methyltransferase
MNTPIYPYICPFCGKELKLINKSYVCENEHCIDVAHSGYVNLLPVNQKNSNDPGDNKEMIQARVSIMNKGYYKALADNIIELLREFNPTSIVDTGCGIGYLPYRLNEAFPKAKILGTDISKFAIISASKQYKNIPFAVASSNNLPIKANSVNAIVCAFAPVFSTEFKRILAPDGVFVRVIPDEKHLFKLKEKLYDTPYINELDIEEIDGFTLLKKIKVRDIFTAEKEEILNLVKMTPYYYHTKKSSLDALCLEKSLTTNLELEVRLYKLNSL